MSFTAVLLLESLVRRQAGMIAHRLSHLDFTLIVTYDDE
jgi:hypothetical protein